MLLRVIAVLALAGAGAGAGTMIVLRGIRAALLVRPVGVCIITVGSRRLSPPPRIFLRLQLGSQSSIGGLLAVIILPRRSIVAAPMATPVPSVLLSL